MIRFYFQQFQNIKMLLLEENRFSKWRLFNKRNEENFNSIFFLADSSIGIVYIPSDEDGVYRRYYPFAKMPYQEVYAPSFAISMFNKAINGKGNSTPNLKKIILKLIIKTILF